MLLFQFSLFPSCFAGQINLYLLTQPSSVGDRNQILGFARELERIYKDDQIKIREMSYSPHESEKVVSVLQSELKSNPQFSLVVTSGQDGIEAVKNIAAIRPQIERLKIIHLAHQQFSNHEDLIDKADFIFLPKYAVKASFKEKVRKSKSKLLTTLGVFYNLSLEEIEESYLKYSSLIPSAKQYVGVILAGDVAELNEGIKYYSRNEAEKLARWIAKEYGQSNTAILVLNGPRTGKYDPETGKVRTDAHRNGEADFVTTAFVNELRSQLKNKAQSQVVVFDFQFGQPSQYNTVLGAVKRKKGILLAPGESTSMVSETVDLLSGQVIVYENLAMNATHQTHIQTELDAGKVKVLNSNFKLILPNKVSNESYRWQDALKELNISEKKN